MENYIVSARKYRPSTFKSVVGQKALTRTLKNAIDAHKLAHAYLFCGPRGVGKTSCARYFAKPSIAYILRPMVRLATNVSHAVPLMNSGLIIYWNWMPPQTMASTRYVHWSTKYVFLRKWASTRFLLSTRCTCFLRRHLMLS